ncbi:DNA mismatch repair protein MutL [Thalassotalea insulae]|uniref:DNA mismatch repair protein MutL n=1 Tax=Thalassotalea insulae TaxID=2056778 RepID=A0ABQ6GQA3_9GAMM|nr:DNA mismatch repair endonuclease MutL [Thalassotalea insulae]GLX78150.1 DNA mismatch repair protein MutL [Thalassotalea insulae]
MTIEILPARLANQIAAGEVVERPASVVKELVENSLDAGATAIKIDIEKGGAKRIRISDNGCGIAKEELTLALSRHATSKIKNLTDLEAICSLGFRGEALASISSVARLTLTSKTAEQENAWQACAQGRDMDVVVQPAAHTKGTTIDVVDLFFNTPARRKFLRTEKTEFSHIEEVIKRIALARFDVAFTLTHNHKTIRQYRVANSDSQKAKRVAQVCGQAFIEHAIKVDCQHDGLHLSGWIAQPSFSRNQNDLCYSYVNGRMMRDKLINHAIRQSYQEMLPSDGYPAFVLFLELNAREVDVNVHPAKHEVRFHQGRYVHDFIYSVCHRALIQTLAMDTDEATDEHAEVERGQAQTQRTVEHAYQQSRDYVTKLQPSDNSYGVKQPTSHYNQQRTSVVNSASSQAYQQLMTPHQDALSVEQASPVHQSAITTDSGLQFVAPAYALYFADNQPRLLSLVKLKRYFDQKNIARQWQSGLTSQPLLLPVKLVFSAEEIIFIENNITLFKQAGIVVQLLANNAIQIRQFPALLRHQDVSASFNALITKLMELLQENKTLTDESWQFAVADVMNLAEITEHSFDQSKMNALYYQLVKVETEQINQQLLLNSVVIDLTSAIQALS